MSKDSAKNYFTVKELMALALKMAEQDEFSPELDTDMLDYQMVSYGAENCKLKRIDFDVLSSVQYGASEGIYGHICVRGDWLPEAEQSVLGHQMLIYVLKTLRDDKLAYFAMGAMVTMLSYYVNKAISENLDRFD